MARRRGRDRLSRYTVYVTPVALREIKRLPGAMRQRAKRAIEGLADVPRPADSTSLEVSQVEPEVRRLRLDQWRIVYAVTEADQVVDVLGVRKRPPYDYADLQDLIAELLPPDDE